MWEAPVNKYTFLFIFTGFDPAAQQKFGLKRRPTEAKRSSVSGTSRLKEQQEKNGRCLSTCFLEREEFNSQKHSSKFYINIYFAFIRILFCFIH